MDQDGVLMREMQSRRTALSSVRSPHLLFMLVIIFVDMFGFAMVVPLLPVFVQRHAGGPVLVGVLGSLYAGMQVVGAPLVGSLADHLGRRPVLIACLVGSFLAYLALGFADSLPVLAAAVAFGGLMGGSFTTAQAYIAEGAAPEARTRWLGLAGAAVGLGIAAGPLVGGLLGDRGLRVPALLASVLALANAGFGFIFVREIRPVAQAGRGRPPLKVHPLGGLLAVVRDSRLRLLLLTLGALNLSFIGLPLTFPLFSRARFGWSPANNGPFFALIGGCAVFARVPFSAGSRRASARRGSSNFAAATAAVMFTLVVFARGRVDALSAHGSPGHRDRPRDPFPDKSPGPPDSGVHATAGMGGTQAMLSACMIVGPAMAGTVHQAFGPAAPTGWERGSPLPPCSSCSAPVKHDLPGRAPPGYHARMDGITPSPGTGNRTEWAFCARSA